MRVHHFRFHYCSFGVGVLGVAVDDVVVVDGVAGYRCRLAGGGTNRYWDNQSLGVAAAFKCMYWPGQA